MADTMTPFWVTTVATFPIIFGAFFIISYYLTKVAKFDFTFTIGDKEKHEIRFYSERMLGQNKIYVDGVQKLSKLSLINGDSHYSISVGEVERHELLLHVKMDVLFGSYKRRTCLIYVNGVLVTSVVSGG